MTLFLGSGLTVGTTPARASGSGTAGGHVPPITASAAGGDGAYSYEWTRLSSSHDIVINSPNSATTDFDFSGVGAGEVATAVVRVTVTDGGLTASRDVNVTFQNRQLV